MKQKSGKRYFNSPRPVQGREHRRHHSARSVLLSILFLFLMLGINSFLVMKLSEWLFSVLHVHPFDFIQFLIRLFAVLVFISLESRVIFRFFRPHEDFFSVLIQAIQKISKGEYDVDLPAGEGKRKGRFSQLTGSLTEMVVSLKEMEKLRQEFISNVSHEIRSPLTSIAGFARVLKDENLDPEQRRAYLNIIEEESKRLSKLGENMLEMTRLESDNNPLELSQFRLDSQIRAVLLSLEPQWDAKNIDIQVDLKEWEITGDADLLIQVWNNLIQNAIKFTPEKGFLKITQVQSKEDETKLKLEFTDSGIGIAGDDLPFVFDRFFKADSARSHRDKTSGSGLGLAIVKKIIELHQGALFVSSPGLDKGSTFTILLPIAGPIETGKTTTS